MAQQNSRSSGTSKDVNSMREQYELDREKQQLNFKAAKEALRRFKDPNISSNITLNKYDRDTIRDYLQNPAKNQINLLKAANYLYIRSQIFYRIVHWYAGMWDLRCREVEPHFDFVKGLDKNALKNYNDTINQLDIYNLQENMFEVLCRCYLEDVCYFLWLRDETGAFPYVLDPTECVIDGEYMTGDLSFSIDMSKWRSKNRQNLIEWLGEPLVSMWREYESTKLKYIHVPDEYAGCFKFNKERLDIIIPPLAGIMQMCSGLLNSEDLQAIQDEMDIFKLLILPMKTISSSKTADDFQVTPDLLLDYFEKMVEQSLPSYIAAAPIPGDGVDVVDFSTTSTDKDIDKIANSQKNIFGVSGGGAVLNANNITSTAAFNAWLQAETDFAISSLIGQINGFTNRMLSYDVSNPCKVKHFELSEYTKKDFREALLTANQYGYMYRLALGTLYGITEKQTLASLQFEQSIGLQNIMIYPLQSSFTNSSNGEIDTDPVTGGRPATDDSDLTDEGDRSRNR